MTFGEKLYQMRRDRGISQEALASEFGVSRQPSASWCKVLRLYGSITACPGARRDAVPQPMSTGRAAVPALLTEAPAFLPDRSDDRSGSLRFAVSGETGPKNTNPAAEAPSGTFAAGRENDFALVQRKPALSR